MNAQYCLAELRATQDFFDRSTRALTEDDRDFTPAEGLMTTAQQIEHVAWSVNWLVDGAFAAKGFDHDFDNVPAPVPKGTPLKEVRQQVDVAFAHARKTFEGCSEAELTVPLPAGPVLGGKPRWSVISSIVDHTAHHRGALTSYARLCGRVPSMPYGDV